MKYLASGALDLQCCFYYALCLCFAGLTDCNEPKGVTLKPVVSKSASQRLLVTSKPMPPIQNSLSSPKPSRMSNGEQEHGENGTDCDDSDGNNKKLMSEVKGYKVRKPSQITWWIFMFISCRQSSEIFPCGVSPGKQLSQGRAQLDIALQAVFATCVLQTSCPQHISIGEEVFK